MNKDILSFFELVSEYSVQIPIIQRDYAQGRERNSTICENFLTAIKNSILNSNAINLDFIYGNLLNGCFLPLDGQQRLTTLFLLHWYAFCKEQSNNESIRAVLKKFSYETRLSSRRFCEALVNSDIVINENIDKLSEQILDSRWFFISWKNDSTIRAMLRTINCIHANFKDVENIWDSLVAKRNVVFHLLILEDFGLSDDLYIKMNARGRLLTPFENLKAEIEDKAERNHWEEDKNEFDKFSYKIDGCWTHFLWQNYRKNNSVDNAHMNFIATLLMVKLSTGQIVKGLERIRLIQKLNDDNTCRELIEYIDKDTFDYICSSYNLYCRLLETNVIPQLTFSMWRHAPEKNLLYQILIGSNSSYSHKVLFFAQTEYLHRNPIIDQEKFSDWMRVVRNIVSRADLSPEGKRSDIVRSPEAFNGAINLVHELATGCGDIYDYLRNNSVSSAFTRDQMKEERIKAEIIVDTPQYKKLIHRVEDNELLRGHIIFALECANYQSNVSDIDFELLKKVQNVLNTYFNTELDNSSLEFDKLRRALLTIEVDGCYRFYNYWWSYWNAGSAEKRKLLSAYREIEYIIAKADSSKYFRKLVLLLVEQNYDEIISGFIKPDTMENWQYRLIKEERLLFNCDKKYIAIPADRSYCYLLKGIRPATIDGSVKIH